MNPLITLCWCKKHRSGYNKLPVFNMKIMKTIDLPLELKELSTSFDDLGNSLLGIRNGKEMCVVDAEAGSLLFTIDKCFDGVEGLCIGDENAVYIAREFMVDRFMTAHDRKTGTEIWHCQLSKNANQFCGPLTQDDKYIYHTDYRNIIVIDKAKGKRINKFKVQNEDMELGTRYIIPWQEKVLYSGWVSEGKGKNKQYSLVLSIYDPLSKDSAYIEDILTVKGRIGLQKCQLIGDMLYYMPYDAVLRVIDLNTKKVVFEHDFVPNGDQTMQGYREGYVSKFVCDGDKVHFMVLTTDTERNKEDNFTKHRYFSTLDTTSWKIDVTEEQDEYVYRDYYYDGLYSFKAGANLVINRPSHNEDKISCGGSVHGLVATNSNMCAVAENDANNQSKVLILNMHNQ